MVDRAIVALDIDGTLIDLAGAGSRAMYRVLSERTGNEGGETTPIVFAGRTDLAIVTELLNRIDEQKSKRRGGAHALRAFFRRYLEILPEELDRTPYSPTPGALDLVQELREDPSVVVGIATGNVEAAAKLKLANAGFADQWDFGAFGDEAMLRSELVMLAISRAKENACTSAHSLSYIMGDTPADIEAARAVGGVAVAVATGPFDEATLEKHAPDVLLSTPAEAVGRPFWRRSQSS